MGQLLTTGSVITCPHGGKVMAAAANARVKLGGEQVVLATDTFTVAGCPFAPVVPHPCTRVQWQLTAQRSACDGAATLTSDSIGICFAADGAVQGVALVAATQTRVAGQ